MKYWYYFTHCECVLCGYITTYKERRYTPRPSSWSHRHEYHDVMCCDHL